MSGPPVTPDGRYIVVRGRLWRRANPDLPEAERAALVARLMEARRAVAAAKRRERSGGAEAAAALCKARAAVDAAKTGLGERGPVWWDDGAPDLNRRMARNTPYAAWFAGLGAQDLREDGLPSRPRSGCRESGPSRGSRAEPWETQGRRPCTPPKG